MESRLRQSGRLVAKAYRTTIQLVVYSDTPIHVDPFAGEGDMYEPLSALIYDVTEGDKIGDWSVTEQDAPVEGDALVTELVAIGNDGRFFDSLLDDDEAWS